MPNDKLSRLQNDIVQPSAKLPSIPEAFQQSDYDGWLVEKIKRLQLKSYQRTQAERLSVLKQIDQIQKQCLAIARNEKDWQHFAQEDRVRAKRLNLDEMKLDLEIEEFLVSRIAAKKPVVEIKAAPPNDPMKEALRRLRNKIRAGVEARSECDQLKREFPEYADEIEHEFTKMITDLRDSI